MTTSLTKGEKPARSRRFFNEWAGIFIFYILFIASAIIIALWAVYSIKQSRLHPPPPVPTPPMVLEIYIDTDTGVQYLTTSKGGITPLLKADGTPDLVPTK